MTKPFTPAEIAEAEQAAHRELVEALAASEARERTLREKLAAQPIATAPKDGTEILVYDPGADWWPLLARWQDDDCDDPYWYSPTGDNPIVPTHWWPLPDAPALETGNGR